jgi:hypothetical protein
VLKSWVKQSMLPDGCRSCFIGCILSTCRLLLPVLALR